MSHLMHHIPDNGQRQEMYDAHMYNKEKPKDQQMASLHSPLQVSQ